jgi:hypothetical protein
MKRWTHFELMRQNAIPHAETFLRTVASRDRSRFVSEALAAWLEERNLELARACEIANQDQDVAEIEKALGGIRDEMAEPWRSYRSAARSGGLRWLGAEIRTTRPCVEECSNKCGGR